MKTRRSTRLLVEPPSSATGDIAFNLIVFFLVCASVQPDSGRRQTLPRSETTQETAPQAEHVEVLLTRTAVAINGEIVRPTIGMFGVDRCMFASNFPVDGLCASFDEIFSGFKSITANLLPADRQKLFHDNAMHYYRPV